MLQFVIWGCGYRGKMLLKCIAKERISAFIDSDVKKQGTCFEDIPIISYETYLEKFVSCFVIVAPSLSVSVKENIINRLENDGVNRYFLLERCPMELPYYENELPFGEMLELSNVLDKGKQIAIAGINLFSVFLYEYMKNKGFDIHLYASDSEMKVVDEIKKDSTYSFLHDVTDECSFLITDRYLDKSNSFDFTNAVKFYRFPCLKKYDYKKIALFRDIHKGERCFIVATGPSLKIEDLNVLHANKEVTISVNTVYNSFDLTKWRPDYLVVTDTGALEIYYDDLLNVDVKYKILADRQYNLWHKIDRDDIVLFHLFMEYFEQEGPDFSSRLDIGAFYGNSVTYCALQLAVYMGFKEIYIIGADCEYKGNGRTEADHFIPNYFSKNGPAGSLIQENMFAAYRSARDYAERRGIKIYNATRGGKLEVFERVDFDSLF